MIFKGVSWSSTYSNLKLYIRNLVFFYILYEDKMDIRNLAFFYILYEDKMDIRNLAFFYILYEDKMESTALYLGNI